MTSLPPPRAAGGTPYRIAIVCLGNICRSPMADVILTDRVEAAGLGGKVEVVSAGTGDWHVGNPMDRRAAALLTAHGYDASQHTARQFEKVWFEDVDVVLAMDSDNLADLEAMRPPDHEDGRLLLFRAFDPVSRGEYDRDVPDPYYGGDDGFETVLAMVERTCDAIVDELRRVVDG